MKHELLSMEAFITLAKSDSFNNAAKLLNIMQPALARRTKKMEEYLYTQFSERITRKVVLTKTGKMLLPEARELIKVLDETIFSVGDMNVHHHGIATLSCIPTVVFYLLPLAIGKFNERCPDTEMRIAEQGTDDCMGSVLCNEADFGINTNNTIGSSIEFTSLVNEPLILACQRDHPLANKQLAEWQELPNHKLIGIRLSSGNRLLIGQYLADKPWKLNWFYEVHHLSISLDLVGVGLGVSALPGLTMPQTPHPTLIGVPLVKPMIRCTLGAIRRKDATLLPPAEHFLSLLLNLWADDKDSLQTPIAECHENLPFVR